MDFTGIFKRIDPGGNKSESINSEFENMLEDVQRQANQPQKNLFPVDIQNDTSSTLIKPYHHSKKQAKHSIINNINQTTTKEVHEHIDIPSLKVKDLKAELKKRGLVTSGLKKVLQRRLRKALEDEAKPNDNEQENNSSEHESTENETSNLNNENTCEEKHIKAEDCEMGEMKVDTIDIISNLPSNVRKSENSTENPVKCIQSGVKNKIREDEMEVDIQNEIKDNANEHIINVNLDDESRLSRDAKSLNSISESVSEERMSVEIINEKLDSMQVISEANESNMSEEHEEVGIIAIETKNSLLSEPSEKVQKTADSQKNSEYDNNKEIEEEESSDCILLRDETTTGKEQFDHIETKDLVLSKTREISKKEDIFVIKEDVKLHKSGLVENIKHNQSEASRKTQNVGTSKLDLGLKSHSKVIAMTNLTIPPFQIASCGSKSANSASTVSSSSSSQASFKKEKLAAQRKARLEEMRGQNKKVTSSSTASSKANMTSYKFNKISSIKFTEKLGEKPERIPQISVAPPAASNKVTRPINQQKTSDKEREEVRKRIAAKMREKVTPSALKYGTPKRKPACTETPKSKVKFQEELNILHPHKLEPHEMSPMDTYEISDNDGSSSSSSDDSDSSDDGKPQKKKPSWSQSENLKAALRRQIAAPDRLDPDRIFGEVTTCNLEEIFKMKKSKYKKRASSGNWTKDELTWDNKIKYKKEMGYQVC